MPTDDVFQSSSIIQFVNRVSVGILKDKLILAIAENSTDKQSELVNGVLDEANRFVGSKFVQTDLLTEIPTLEPMIFIIIRKSIVESFSVDIDLESTCL